MKLDQRLELLVALALPVLDATIETKADAELFSKITTAFEIEEDSVPNVDNSTILLSMYKAVMDIQEMIDEYDALERED